MLPRSVQIYIKSWVFSVLQQFPFVEDLHFTTKTLSNHPTERNAIIYFTRFVRPLCDTSIHERVRPNTATTEAFHVSSTHSILPHPNVLPHLPITIPRTINFLLVDFELVLITTTFTQTATSVDFRRNRAFITATSGVRTVPERDLITRIGPKEKVAYAKRFVAYQMITIPRI